MVDFLVLSFFFLLYYFALYEFVLCTVTVQLQNKNHFSFSTYMRSFLICTNVISCSRNVSFQQKKNQHWYTGFFYVQFRLFFFHKLSIFLFRYFHDFEMHAFFLVITRSLCHCGFQVLTLCYLYNFFFLFILLFYFSLNISKHFLMLWICGVFVFFVNVF